VKRTIGVSADSGIRGLRVHALAESAGQSYLRHGSRLPRCVR
jgi:hypothetical protein